MPDKLSNPVSTSFDDRQWAFAKADSSLMNLEIAPYIRKLLDERMNTKLSALEKDISVFGSFVAGEK
jgi:hypothetical protein